MKLTLFKHNFYHILINALNILDNFQNISSILTPFWHNFCYVWWVFVTFWWIFQQFNHLFWVFLHFHNILRTFTLLRENWIRVLPSLHLFRQLNSTHSTYSYIWKIPPSQTHYKLNISLSTDPKLAQASEHYSKLKSI